MHCSFVYRCPFRYIIFHSCEYISTVDKCREHVTGGGRDRHGHHPPRCAILAKCCQKAQNGAPFFCHFIFNTHRATRNGALYRDPNRKIKNTENSPTRTDFDEKRRHVTKCGFFKWNCETNAIRNMWFYFLLSCLTCDFWCNWILLFLNQLHKAILI